MEILRVENLSKTYGKGENAVEALKDASLTVRQGEIVAVTGQSGSGKSTLLQLMGGLDKPTSGKVFLEGKEIYSLGEHELAVLRRRKFGFIFQFYNLIPVLTVEENITMPLLLDSRQVDREYIDELISNLGLESKRTSLPAILSGGQQQRVSIARALANKPSILFADEPTGNLDSKTGKEVIDLLRLSVRKYHQTLIMITHNPEIAASADRVVFLEDGVIVSDMVGAV